MPPLNATPGDKELAVHDPAVTQGPAGGRTPTSSTGPASG